MNRNENEKIQKIKGLAAEMLENAALPISQKTRARHAELESQLVPMVRELARSVAFQGDDVNEFFEQTGLAEALAQLGSR